MGKTEQFKSIGETVCKNCGIHKEWRFDYEGYVSCKLCDRRRGRNRTPVQKLKYNTKTSFRRKITAPVKTRLELIKSRCKKSFREYNLTPDFIESLFIKQNYKCVLSGFTISKQDFSIDRIDSSKGYTQDNVQLVKLIFNQMKRNLTDQEFINNCKMVASYHGLK